MIACAFAEVSMDSKPVTQLDLFLFIHAPIVSNI
tara:strand:- start:2282 stop:2383 length:102 start_codon:yes stop_codon:yes gene_type:complete